MEHDGTLTFVIPVRHHASVINWGGVKDRLGTTLRSIAAQTHATWRAVVVANEGADLPPLPNGVELVSVDLPNQVLPDRTVDVEAFFEVIRADKGRRVLAGLVHARPSGFAMTVDYDDVVSNRLAKFVSENAGANGWYLNSGYLFSNMRMIYRRPRDFHELCGTSLIVRADLLNLPARPQDASETYIRRTMGSHKFLQSVLSERETPLAPLPFTGAAYRIGHAESGLGLSTLFTRLFPLHEVARRPVHAAARALRLRPIGPKIKNEFFAGFE